MDSSKYRKPTEVDYRKLSDLDFVRNLDLLATNYYSDYLQGRAQITGGVDSFLSRASDSGCVASPYPLKPARVVEHTGYFTRRAFFLFLIFLCSVVELVYAALSFSSLKIMKGTLSLSKDVTFFDPILALFGINSPCSAYFTSDLTKSLPAYFMAGCLIVFAIVSVVKLIVSIRAMSAKRRKGGAYKKYRFGALSIVQFFAIDIVVACAILLGETKIGYGSILLEVLTIVTFFSSCLSYKKSTVTVPENYIAFDGSIAADCPVADFLKKKQ